jgi:hypothetical protein
MFLRYLLLLLIFSKIQAQQTLEIAIDRKLNKDKCTLGYLFVNGDPICYTLELPWRLNANNISCIPAGIYKGFLRYDKPDGWRIQIADVPGRPGIQLHIGNYTSQITGCILLGMEVDIDKCTVYSSAKAYSEFRKSFYGSDNPVLSPDLKIVLKVK